MKHFWALPSTLLLSSALAVTGVAATASIVPGGDASSLDASSLDNGSSTDGRATPPVDTTVLENGFYWQLTSPQLVQPGSVLVWGQGTKARRPGPGRRSDTQFFEISSTGTNDVPDAALRAYHHAEKVMATADPGCDISWTMLAAIGRVESNHGRYGGAQLGSDGVSRPEIRGPQLDGAGPFAAIRDTDNGTLDRDKVWDRAVGQMQFLPGTWREVARDGDGDGQMNPDDIDDSALGSAVYLCGAGGSLADAAGKARAAFRYNHSDYYVDLVLAFDAGYQSGVFALPSPPPPPDEADRRKGHDKPGRKKSAPKKPTSKKHRSPKAPLHQAAPTPAPTPTPKPEPKPQPKPSPPAPTPTGPQLVQVEGQWHDCGNGYCLGATSLDLGPGGTRGDRADADYDGDGTVETNADEFAGLAGKHVSLQVEKAGGGYVVYVIGGHGYRNADGSFARRQNAAQPSGSPSP